MKSIFNINAIREALNSGISATVLHDMLEDAINEMQAFNRQYGEKYAAVSYAELERVQNELNKMQLDYKIFQLKKFVM